VTNSASCPCCQIAKHATTTNRSHSRRERDVCVKAFRDQSAASCWDEKELRNRATLSRFVIREQGQSGGRRFPEKKKKALVQAEHDREPQARVAWNRSTDPIKTWFQRRGDDADRQRAQPRLDDRQPVTDWQGTSNRMPASTLFEPLQHFGPDCRVQEPGFSHFASVRSNRECFPETFAGALPSSWPFGLCAKVAPTSFGKMGGNNGSLRHRCQIAPLRRGIGFSHILAAPAMRRWLSISRIIQRAFFVDVHEPGLQCAEPVVDFPAERNRAQGR